MIVPHLLDANMNSYAPTTILVGDPNRASMLANEFLRDVIQVNSYRGFLGYTGSYKKAPVSFQSTGIGTPSAAIVVEELIKLGVKNLIRIGTCAGIDNLSLFDKIVATESFALDGTSLYYSRNRKVNFFLKINSLIARPSKKMLASLDKASELIEAKIVTVDNYYNSHLRQDIVYWKTLNINAVEMETSIIYLLAQKNNIEALSTMVVSDVFGQDDSYQTSLTSSSKRQTLNQTLCDLTQSLLDIFLLK